MQVRRHADYVVLHAIRHCCYYSCQWERHTSHQLHYISYLYCIIREPVLFISFA